MAFTFPGNVSIFDIDYFYPDSVFYVYTAISKNVVGENDECQLSNGDCTTEMKCGY